MSQIWPNTMHLLGFLFAGPLLLVVSGAVHGQESAAMSAADGKKLLEGKGLVRSSSVWISPTEVRLRKLLEARDGANRRFYQAELARWELILGRLHQFLKEETAKPARDVQRQRALTQELSAAQGHCERFAKLLKVPPPARKDEPVREETLRRKIAESMEARNGLLLSVLELDRLTDEAVVGSYEPLQADPEILTALESQIPQARLGPLRKYNAARREHDKTAAEVLTDVIPLLPRDGRYAISGLLGERLPATFLYSPDNDLTMVPEKLVRMLEIPLTDATPRITLSIGEHRFDAYRVRIPSLRLGKHQLLDIPAAVVPSHEPQSEPRLGRKAFSQYAVTLEVDRLEFRLTPRAGTP